jgi:predicted TIM-barrel fold metal-dependent hydrolase
VDTAPRSSSETTPVLGVDAHAHVLKRDMPLVAGRHSAPKRDASVDEYVALLDANGISHGLLTAPSFYGPDNTLLTASLRRFPTRLRGTAIIEPSIADEALVALDAAGIVGMRLNWLRRDVLPDFTADNYRSLFARVGSLNWHVEIYLEGAKLATVLPTLRTAGVRVVVDHFGSPDPAHGVRCPGFQAVLEGVRAGDTWVKLSAPYRLGGADPQAYVDALLAAGRGQLVWATDWPFVGFEDAITYRQCVQWLHEWIPDADTRRMIVADTPARLFGFGDGSNAVAGATRSFYTERRKDT